MTIQDIYRERCENWSDIYEHLPFMHDFVIRRNAQTVVELGTRTGNSTAAFLAALEVTGGHLWAVDIRLPRVPMEYHESGRWTFVLGDDLAVADQVGPQIEVTNFGDPEPRYTPGAIDVLFIDSSHFYDHTLAELRLYGPRSRTILLHDTELEHPDGAPTDPAFPVKTAVLEYVAETGRSFTNRENCYGLGIIGGG